MNLVGFCLVGYVAGLLLAPYFDLPFIPLLLLACFSLLLLFFKRNSRIACYLLLLFCLLIGLLRDEALFSSHNNPLDPFVGTKLVRILGQVLASHERPRGGVSIDLAVERLGPDLHARGYGQRLRLYVGQATVVPVVGSSVIFASRIRRLSSFGIPGEFDYVRHLSYRGIQHSAYLSHSRSLAVFAPPEGEYATWIDLVRRAGLRILDQGLSPERALLLKGLLLGEKSAMPQELRQTLANGGIAHLFAISGLHLGLLAFLLYCLFKFLYGRSSRLLLWQPPRRVLWFLILPLLFLYLLLTGDALSTRRAFYALLVPVVLSLLRRRVDPLHLLFGLAFLFLLFEPLALWQPSMQLSFSGVLGILLWQQPVQRLLSSCPGFVRYPLMLFAISLAAFLSTLPFVIMSFHPIAPAGLLANLFAIPLVSFVALPTGLFGLLLSSFWASAGALLLGFSATLLQWVVRFSSWINDLPALSAQRLFLTLPENLALLLFCFSLLIGWRFRRGLWLLIPAVCLMGISPRDNTTVELIMFSVGQGESMLLRVNGENFLVDGGGLRSKSFDVGERLLAPALGRLGVDKLAAVLLTHNHPDHSGGLAYIVEHFKVRQFWSGVPLQRLAPNLRSILQEKEVELHEFKQKGWHREQIGQRTSVSLYIAQGLRGENNRSLCLYLTTPAGGILLTGDLEAQGVSALLQSAIPGPVVLLKAPHHGSAGSKPRQLVAQLGPELILASVGYDNPYHFPSSRLLDQAAKDSIRVWRTDLDGTVQVRVEGKKWQVRHWSKGLFR
ncbi:MAG: DNA internalization-related competence protein ComEC/Rec2 [Geopsychrobacter sp.]|nr:DNA internalization-related competence protein ComEC/Rec2 [Geopsychrobacter sp.]